MPVSKNGKPYYTKEQYRQAKYQSNALDYALRKGYPLVKQGKYYYMKEHDSMVFAPNGMWFWNARGLKGRALDFMVQYENRPVQEAVLELSGAVSADVLRQGQKPVPSEAAAQQQEAPPKGVFQLPEKVTPPTQLFNYLCTRRRLKYSVVLELLRQGLLYEGVHKYWHNAVFVYKDPDGKPVGAFQRGLRDAVFKKNVEDSCKDYGWLLRGRAETPTQVYVFEGAIDAASHLSLCRLRGLGKEYVDRLSLEGLAPTPLQNYLERNPRIRRIVLLLDNDGPGRAAAERLRAQFAEQVAKISVEFPPEGKDWNDALIAYREQMERLEVRA